jgi:hypothetical protein
MLWKLFLLLSLFPGVGEEDDQNLDELDENVDELDEDDGAEEDEEEEADEEEELDDEGEPIQKKAPSRSQKRILSLNERAQKAEQDRDRLARELDEARRQTSKPVQKDEVWEREEQVLNDPNASDWQKYAVTSARNSRVATFKAQHALQRAEDLADKADFDRLSITKPKLYETYKDRVEEARTTAIKNGHPAPPRANVLKFLVGQDMVEGKLKSTTQKKTQKAKRQAPPGARSDVSSKGSRLSEAEKRAKRLEGQLI